MTLAHQHGWQGVVLFLLPYAGVLMSNTALTADIMARQYQYIADSE